MTNFKEKRILELFEVRSSKHNYFANQISNIYSKRINGTHPYIVRATTNNGLKGFIKGDKEFLNPGNTISFAQDSFVAYYQKDSYFTGNKVKVLVPKFSNVNTEILLYMVTSINKTISEFSWGIGSTVESIENISIQVPFNDSDEIDWNYISNYINRIEIPYVKKIELFLNELGYSKIEDIVLNSQDEQILKNHNESNFNKFKLSDIFSWQPNVEIDPLKINDYTDSDSDYNYPFIGHNWN